MFLVAQEAPWVCCKECYLQPVLFFFFFFSSFLGYDLGSTWSFLVVIFVW